MRGRGRRGLLAAAGLAGLAAGALGWVVTDRLERRNTFCVSCHLTPETPLHEAKLAGLRARPPETLAAAHGAAGVEASGGEREFRCIDCHGGTGALGRMRVKALSARDAFWYVAGHFEEPERMRFPLWDSDCRPCHGDLGAEGRAAPGEEPAFHDLAVHNHELGVSCVTCHVAHERDGLEGFHFLHPSRVRAQCASCHPEMEETGR